MARITVEDCLDKVENRFELVMIATKRARQLALTNRDPLVPVENDKHTVIALREIAKGLVTKESLEHDEHNENQGNTLDNDQNANSGQEFTNTPAEQQPTPTSPFIVPAVAHNLVTSSPTQANEQQQPPRNPLAAHVPTTPIFGQQPISNTPPTKPAEEPSASNEPPSFGQQTIHAPASDNILPSFGRQQLKEKAEKEAQSHEQPAAADTSPQSFGDQPFLSSLSLSAAKSEEDGQANDNSGNEPSSDSASDKPAEE